MTPKAAQLLAPTAPKARDELRGPAAGVSQADAGAGRQEAATLVETRGRALSMPRTTRSVLVQLKRGVVFGVQNMGSAPEGHAGGDERD